MSKCKTENQSEMFKYKTFDFLGTTDLIQFLTQHHDITTVYLQHLRLDSIFISVNRMRLSFWTPCI